MTALLVVALVMFAWSAGFWQGRHRSEKPEVIVTPQIINEVHYTGTAVTYKQFVATKPHYVSIEEAQSAWLDQELRRINT